MNYEELKKFCDEKIKDFPDYEKRYKKELVMIKRVYAAGRNLYDEFVEKKDLIDNRYVVPFLLDITKKIEDKIPEYIQILDGNSGGIDVDVDFSPSGREKIIEHLKERYGNDKVFGVGTFNQMKIKSAIKDVFRVYGFEEFGEINSFTKVMDDALSYEENITNVKDNFPHLYKFYLQHKTKFDLVPKFLGKIRSGGMHAGGKVLLDKPIYNYIPVERAGKDVVTAFPESGSDAVLDHYKVIKLDLLGITILDVIKSTLEMIVESGEKIFEVEDDSGVTKWVPESYLKREGFL